MGYGSYGANPYGGMYNSYNTGFGGGYGGGYGGYGGGYGGYGGVYPNNGTPESNFVRLAEESSRGAFQSIESVVNAFASVANMLSSTHNAVFSSFRAVIGLVEQFSTMKKTVSVFFIATVFKWIKYLWRLLLVYLRLKPANYANTEMAWTDSQNLLSANDCLPGGVSSGGGVNWPMAIFWAVALGGPYLIYKCISRMVSQMEEKRKWATGAGEHYNSQALYDFQASTNQELSFNANEILRIAPKSEQPPIRGWLLASSEDGQRIGLVPINYVKIMNRNTASPPALPNNPLDNLTSSKNMFENAFKPN
uniref:Peroxisomal membrane protein PEX13 n=1 Tax=Acrobeloides nanus TaxID=290746 RepID=A0A914DFV0_9BILA